jgi:hypothetical protein
MTTKTFDKLMDDCCSVLSDRAKWPDSETTAEDAKAAIKKMVAAMKNEGITGHAADAIVAHIAATVLWEARLRGGTKIDGLRTVWGLVGELLAA